MQFVGKGFIAGDITGGVFNFSDSETVVSKVKSGLIKLIVDGEEVFSCPADGKEVKLILDGVNCISSTSTSIVCNQATSIKTSSGDVTTKDCSGNITTSSGDVTVENSYGKIITSSGDITVVNHRI